MSSIKHKSREVISTPYELAADVANRGPLNSGLRDTNIVKSDRYRVSMPPSQDGGRAGMPANRGTAAHALAEQY